ncbi:hypothetical protein BV22DRAFT_1105596 [Leucogyrophana mollusca]|uniref:Uncharacterized protein n=1 Tax=Leucogyrophana mollusca TaxID=85980 RepID=A0ACB8BHK5_9AGAM|nr:hypothetical protein BV22DRAFT_1105596 [Leucogyrophana mollusca]
MSEQAIPTRRVFPPLYVASGDVSVDRLAFFHVLERLKTQKRTGWVDHKEHHMYRMAILALCTSDTKLDVSKCVMMCLVHDLAEAQVGDITPREGISKPEKRRLEGEAMQNFVHEMLHGSPAALQIEALWKEYEEQETDEAKFVKDLDRFEMATQALEYEKADGTPRLQSFFDSSLPFLRHAEVKEWGEAVTRERQSIVDKQHNGARLTDPGPYCG